MSSSQHLPQHHAPPNTVVDILAHGVASSACSPSEKSWSPSPSSQCSCYLPLSVRAYHQTMRISGHSNTISHNTPRRYISRSTYDFQVTYGVSGSITFFRKRVCCYCHSPTHPTYHLSSRTIHGRIYHFHGQFTTSLCVPHAYHSMPSYLGQPQEGQCLVHQMHLAQ